MLVGKPRNVYKTTFMGTSGNIGKGDNIEIFYLQSSLDMNQIEKIKLLGEIKGSKKWKVTELFQRKIDYNRVDGKGGLVEYFLDDFKIKFFNPITMVILPFNDNNIDRNIEKLVKDTNASYNDSMGVTLEKENYFKLFMESSDSNGGVLDINPDKCEIVALDGQHRLAALKSVYTNSRFENNEVTKWKIPVIFIVCDLIDTHSDSRNYIQVLRNIFTYINMEARTINESRAILLNDESFLSICVQEIIEKIHDSDNIEDSYDDYIPLYLIDWQGDEQNINKLPIMDNIELKNVLGSYIIGNDNFKKKGKLWKRLNLEDSELDFDFVKVKKISQKDSNEIRKQFNKDLRGSILNFIINLKPIQSIINDWKEVENKALKDDNYASQAFDILKYGYEKREKNEEIANALTSYTNKLEDIKNKHLTEFMLDDIWLRGFFSGLGMLYDKYTDLEYNTHFNSNVDCSWNTLVDKFSKYFNKLIDDGWCYSYNELSDMQESRLILKLLTNICHSKNGKRINYRFNDIRNAWGIFVLMSVINYAEKDDEVIPEFKLNVWDSVKDRLRSTLEKGFKTDAQDETAELQITASERKNRIDDLKVLHAMKRINELCDIWDISHEFTKEEILVISDKYQNEDY